MNVQLPGGCDHQTNRGAEQGDPLGGIEAAAALLDAVSAAKDELEGKGVLVFDTWYLDDGQLFCHAKDVDIILKTLDTHLSHIGASRATGDNIKSTVRFYGVVNQDEFVSEYTKTTCKVHFDGDGTASHVLGIDTDVFRGEHSAFDDQFELVAEKVTAL